MPGHARQMRRPGRPPADQTEASGGLPPGDE
jgi:hypothetical protein